MKTTNYTFPPQCNTVRDFDLYQLYEDDMRKLIKMPYKKQIQSNETRASETTECRTIMEDQLRKMSIERIQTSFQSNIYDQHLQTVQKHLLQYFQNSFPHFKNQSKHQLLQSIFGREPNPSKSHQKLNQLVKKDTKYFDENHRKLFLTTLFYEQTLYNFLALIANFTHSQLALEVGFVGSLFWQFYKEREQVNLKQQEIQSLVEEALNSGHFQQELSKLQHLSLRQIRSQTEIGQEELDMGLKKLLRILGNTFIMVVEEYFMNKFSKDQQNEETVRRNFNFVEASSDEFSDDEEQFHFCSGSKKRKT